MANSLYDWGRDAFANGLIAWTTDTIKMIPLSSAYVPNLATDKFLSDITTGILDTAQPLTSKSTSAGSCLAGPVSFSGVANGAIISQYVIYKDTGTSSTSRLIGYINVTVPYPVTSDGGTISITFTGNVVFEL
jgi:hypothetical protein